MGRNYQQLDEESLLRDMKYNGKESAFQELFYRYQDRVFRYAIKIVPTREVAEEILQDVFLKVWNYRAQIDENKPFSALLFKIAKNTILNTLKQQKTHLQLTPDTIEHLAFHICPEHDMIWKQYVNILNDALATLPDRCREIFQKSRFEGLSYEEIAQEMGISKDTVRLQIIKSLKQLKKYLLLHPEFDAVLMIMYLVIIS